MMKQRKRDYFDRQVHRVLAALPRKVNRLLETVPLHVEDRPPLWLRRKLGVRNPCGLLGCFTGVPLDVRLRNSNTGLPTMIAIYRSGIFQASRNAEGRLDRELLREQIRITILHEVGHYYGMNERQLRELGY